MVYSQPCARRYVPTFTMAVLAATWSCLTHAVDCNRSSFGLAPINDLAKSFYLGQFQGGLYPDGLNTPPTTHNVAGRLKANSVTRLDSLGNPDPNGAIVLLSIGMSNATQEFCNEVGVPPCNTWSFTGQALAHPGVNHTSLLIANGAKGGQTSESWDSPSDGNYDRVRDEVLLPMALTESQVQIVWVKLARAYPDTSLPDQNADAFILLKELGDITRAIKLRYPNVKLMFLSSRIYAGYASSLLNPEPYAYESGFAVKWLIEAQIRQRDSGDIDPIAGNLGDAVAPWLGWSAYLWADGEIPRSDGLSWTCTDFESDGTHPAQSAEEKVGKFLLNFFLESPYTQPWFTADSTPPAFSGTTGVLEVPATIAPGDELTITIIDEDINVHADKVEDAIVTVVNDSSNESEVVTLVEIGLKAGIFRGSLATLESAIADVNNNNIISIQTGDRLTVTYNDDADETGSPAILATQIEVNSADTTDIGVADNANNSNSGGGCTLNVSGGTDPTLPSLLSGILVFRCMRKFHGARCN